jgi:signal transduction histidine kinase
MKILKSNEALRITALYVLFAGIWISISDWLLGLLFSDSHLIALISLGKGWFFIAVTATVLFVIMQREFSYRKAIEQDIRNLNAELEQRVLDRTHQLEAANSELASFSYSVSHDLRAPLRSMDGFSQILMEDYADRLDEEGLKYLRNIRNASQHMARLIDALLQLAHLSRSEMNFQEIDLSRMAHEIVAEIQASDPGRVVQWEIEPGLLVRGDPDQMRIALANLLQNAWKFTSRNPSARISFTRVADTNPLTFRIEDNGAGFDMTFADKLFLPFQRLHHASEFSGTGIGLTLVERIIRRHGGKIWASGEVGKGAVFYFTL